MGVKYEYLIHKTRQMTTRKQVRVVRVLIMEKADYLRLGSFYRVDIKN